MNELTRILNVITPQIYLQYIQEITAELSAFVQSGVAQSDSRVSANINSGGTLVNLPFWQDLANSEDQTLDDGSRALTTNNIQAQREVAAVMYRGNGWAVNELAAQLSGDDPMGAILNRFGAWWLRREQAILLSVMRGLFAPGGALHATHLLDRSNENISAEAILDTKQLLGDAADRVSLLIMHSAVFTELQKQNLIAFIPNARGEVNMPTYLGYLVVVDDGMPVDNGVYTTLLMGANSIAREIGNPTHITAFETNRDAARGNDEIFTRQAYVMHPRGIKWTGAVQTEITPTNANLANPANWELVFEPKNVAILALKHRVGDAVGGATVSVKTKK